MNNHNTTIIHVQNKCLGNVGQNIGLHVRSNLRCRGHWLKNAISYIHHHVMAFNAKIEHVGGI